MPSAGTRLPRRQRGANLLGRILAVAVALGGVVVLQLASNANSATATSGVALSPAEGQFVPVAGKAAANFVTGLVDDASGLRASSMSPGSVYRFSVADAGVPTSASAVALEYLVTGNFPGVLHSGSDSSPTRTSVTWPANYQRAGFDTVQPNSSGTVYIKPVRSDSNSGGTISAFSVTIHGYYTGSGSTQVGSTFVGNQPTLLYDSGAPTTPAMGPNGGRSVPRSNSQDLWMGVSRGLSVTS